MPRFGFSISDVYRVAGALGLIHGGRLFCISVMTFDGVAFGFAACSL